MKNLTNKKNGLKKSITYLLLFTVLIISNCKKDDEPLRQNCGCDSETINTIPNIDIQIPIEEQKRGFIFYKHPEINDDFYNTEYNNRFWIFQKTLGCNTCKTHFIICNENLLGTEFNYLKQQNVYDSIEVQFSGDIKWLCVLKATPTAYRYSEIVLNSIELQ